MSSRGDDDVVRRLAAAAQVFREALVDGTGSACDEVPTSIDITELIVLVERAELAVAAAAALSDAQRQSHTDALTGLWNRRYLDLAIDSELVRCVRFAESFSLLFCDIDNFKAINDRLGHPAGDHVLTTLGQRLGRATREVDEVARYGGDEFVLVLPRTDLPGALSLAEKIRSAVRSAPFTIGRSDVPVTVSVGVSTFPDHGSTAGDLLARADSALYKAKATGGDRVEHFRCNE